MYTNIFLEYMKMLLNILRLDLAGHFQDGSFPHCFLFSFKVLQDIQSFIKVN